MQYKIGQKLFVSLSEEHDWDETKYALNDTYVTISKYEGVRELEFGKLDPNGVETYRILEDGGKWFLVSDNFIEESKIIKKDDLMNML